MSNYSYSSSSKRPVIISGGSSSRDSTYYNSQASDYSTAHSSMSYEQSREQRYRVPDNEDKYITGTTSKDGRVAVYNHQKPIYDEAAPRSSDYRESRAPRESRSSTSSNSKKHRTHA